MDVFKLKDSLITNYASYIRSFINIRDNTIKQKVDNYLDEGNLWPEALIQLNPAFESGGYIDELVMQGLLHAECSNIFRINKRNVLQVILYGYIVTNWMQLRQPGRARILEITYTTWDLTPSSPANAATTDHSFRWDEERRFLIRCELDAAYFHLYGIERDDVDYIMDTFPIVKRKDEATYGSYLTKETIIAIYDQMNESIQFGQAYQTVLDHRLVPRRMAYTVRKTLAGTHPQRIGEPVNMVFII